MQTEEYISYLNAIYQNLTTALQSIEDIMGKVEDGNLKKELSNEYSDYDIIARECEMIAKSENIDIKDKSFFEKAKLWNSINVSTIVNKTTRKLGEMLLLGTVMGVIDCIKSLYDFENVSSELDSLNQKVLSMEEKNFESLKIYLK